MTRICEAIGCNCKLRPGMFLCPAHWRAVPADIQRTINTRYRLKETHMYVPTTTTTTTTVETIVTEPRSRAILARLRDSVTVVSTVVVVGTYMWISLRR